AGLAEAGGLDALFATPHETPPAKDRKMRFRRRNGEEIPVDALLQSVAWNGGKALLLALRPFAAPAAVPAADPAGSPEVEARIAELTTILDTATDGIVIIDDDGKVRSISRAAE